MLWVGLLLQARDDLINQMNKEPIYCYIIGAPKHFDKVSNTLVPILTHTAFLLTSVTLSYTEIVGTIFLHRRGIINRSPE